MIELTVAVHGLRYDVRFNGDDVESITPYGSCEDIRADLYREDPALLECIEVKAARQKIIEYGSEWDRSQLEAAERKEREALATNHAIDSRRDYEMERGIRNGALSAVAKDPNIHPEFRRVMADIVPGGVGLTYLGGK